MKNNLTCYSDDINVISTSIWSNWKTFSNEMPNSLIEIKTVKWQTYRTSLIDENEFACLVNQTMWDKIKLLKVRNTCISDFMNSAKISEYIKSKVQNII